MRSITICIITLALLTAGLVSVPLVPRLLADEPPTQSPSATGTGNVAGTAPGAQGPVSPGVAPTTEESAPSAEAGDIQERGLLPSKLSPGAVQGGTLRPLPRYSAPTPSLNFVANAIQLSFPATNTVDLRVPANPAITVPVEVSVAYSTSGRRLTETYKPTTGIQLRYADDLRDGLSRLMRLDIALRELIPNGQSFTFSTQFTMTPLFNVTITPLKFFLYADCDAVGKSDIYLRWTSPDDKGHKLKFKLKGGQTREIAEFAWSARNVGLANLFEPGMRFNEEDVKPQFTPEKIALTRKLTPPTIKDFNYIVHEDYDNFCKARVTYRIVLTLL
ncbi:MAG: hypothetical protein P0111_10505 [Nitrospira sp.]|nr:hypothetical protein [Nitrospira sp.]